MDRVDGRSPEGLRPVRITPGYLAYAEGSALIEIGETTVLCAASLEDSVPPFRMGTGGGWLTAEYGMLPRSTQTRTPRETSRPRGRTSEIQRLIGRSLRAVVDLDRIGQQTLRIDCDVIQADGGTRTASITGAYVALYQAVQGMIAGGLTRGDPIEDSVAAISVGILEGAPLLDLCYREDASAEVDMNVVMTGSGGFVEIQGAAEGGTFTEEEMNRMLVLARGGIVRLTELQGQVLGQMDGGRWTMDDGRRTTDDGR